MTRLEDDKAGKGRAGIWQAGRGQAKGWKRTSWNTSWKRISWNMSWKRIRLEKAKLEEDMAGRGQGWKRTWLDEDKAGRGQAGRGHAEED